MSKATILHADDAAKVMYGAGDSYRFLVSNAESNGRIFAMEAVVPPGGGPPLHIQIMIPFIKGMVGKFMAKDMDSVTAYCDRAGSKT